MKQKINSNLICSSDNYESSIKRYFNELKRNHEQISVVKETIVQTKYYVKVFDKVIEISDKDRHFYESVNFKIHTL